MVIHQYKLVFNDNPKAPPTTDITRLFLTAKSRIDNQDSSCWNCGIVTSGGIVLRVLRFSKIIAWDVTVILRHTELQISLGSPLHIIITPTLHDDLLS
jgi:hypothetical protein